MRGAGQLGMQGQNLACLRTSTSEPILIGSDAHSHYLIIIQITRIAQLWIKINSG